MNSGFITQLEPPVLPVSPEKSEPLEVIKNEPPESEIMEIGMDIFNTSDSKDIDIVLHTLCEGIIKSETISENILETVLVKTENVKIENIIESENLIKTEDTRDDNGQEVVEVQETDEQKVPNFSNNLNGISVRRPNPEYPEKTDFADHRTREITSLEEIKAKIKVIKAPAIPVKSHEYITLSKNKYVCNHCQLTCKKLNSLKSHIRTKHREVTTMYQCLYCSFNSKWRPSVRFHVIHMHKGTRDNLKYNCDKCDYKTYFTAGLKSHKVIHLNPKEIQYFYCNLCSYKSKQKSNLKVHIFRHHFKNNLKRYCCNKCTYKTYIYQNLKNHKITHLKPEEIQYFHCYHCSYKCKHKISLKIHILTHFQREDIKFDCYICDFTTLNRDMIIRHLKKHFKHHTESDEAKRKYQLETYTKIRYHYCNKCNYKTYNRHDLKRHKIIHLKSEKSQYFYCYHCSFKSKHKISLKSHIFTHFKNGDVQFHCYICNYMMRKREAIVEHLKKHSKVQIKSEVNEES